MHSAWLQRLLMSQAAIGHSTARARTLGRHSPATACRVCVCVCVCV